MTSPQPLNAVRQDEYPEGGTGVCSLTVTSKSESELGSASYEDAVNGEDFEDASDDAQDEDVDDGAQLNTN